MSKDLEYRARLTGVADNNEQYVNVKIQGKLLEFKVKFHSQCKPPGKRGVIRDFSPAARLAMIKEFMRIDFDLMNRPLFVTLTYPDEHAMPDHDERQVHLKVMARHLERITGQHVPAAWRMEWAARKSGAMIGTYCPHWHLLIFRIGFIPYAQINDAWKRTIGHDGYIRTDVRRVDKNGCTQMYMAKYISKDAVSCSLVIAANQSKLGKQYGWLRRYEIPKHPINHYEHLTDEHRRTLCDLASEMLRHCRRDYEESFTLMGDVARDARKILNGEDLT